MKHRCVTDPAYEDVNNCHERAFVFMHKVGIWRGVCGRASALLGTISPVRCKQASTPSSQCSNKTKVFHGLGETNESPGLIYRAWSQSLGGRSLPPCCSCALDMKRKEATEPVAQTYHPSLFQMPRLWLDYCQFLMDQGRVTHTRRTFDRALRALPITQHSRIWPLYLRFLRSHPLPETAVRGYRRFLKVSTSSGLASKRGSWVRACVQ